MHGGPQSFSVLFVCTGNICRSPMAERLVRARMDPAAPVTVSSAGTGALVGLGIDGPSAVALRELGADTEGHVARRLTAPLIAAADLILTAETAHRSAIVRADPLSFRMAFTIREFVRLAAALPPAPAPTVAGLRSRVLDVAAQRGWAPPPDPGADEIGDPFGAPLQVARDTAAQIAAAVDSMVVALGVQPRAH